MRCTLTVSWAAGLFCSAVPMTHSVCILSGSVVVAALKKPCNGSHMLSFFRSVGQMSSG